MPSRNTIRIDSAETYYHIYVRGASKRFIFLDNADRNKFLSLFARYLSAKPQTSSAGVSYQNFRASIELLAYCLMGNHFHLAVYQVEQAAIGKFMKALLTSYVAFFNLKYKRSGPLFESRFKASRVSSEGYLLHVSRYIHLNPRYWKEFPYSSLAYYLGADPPEWLRAERLSSLFSNPSEYLNFLEDYEGRKSILEEIKYELADR